MTEIRKNEFKDLLEVNEIIYIEHPYFIQSNLPKIGNINYYPKSDKLQIQKKNQYKEGGLLFTKNHLKKVTENLYTENEAGELVYKIIGEYAKQVNIIIDGAKINELFMQLKKTNN